MCWAMGNADNSTLNMIAEKSGGKVIQGEFSTASLGEFEKKMAEVRAYQKKAKEMIKQIQAEREGLEKQKQESLDKLRKRMKRFKEMLHGQDESVRIRSNLMLNK